MTEIVTESAEILSLEEGVASFERMIGYQTPPTRRASGSFATTLTSASMKSGSG